MGILKRRRVAIVAVAAVALLLGGGTAAVAVATSKTGTSVSRVSITTETDAVVYTGGTYQTVGSGSIFAGAGTIVLATFSAESACYAGVGWCSVRILIDGIESDPASGTDFAFDSTDLGHETFGSWESHSMQRTRAVAFTGTHAVVVQIVHVGAGVTSRLDDWTLTSWAIAP
jgi:hypothetical protein